ncbi:phosphopantetheine-binding protein [Streptomyces sp. NPDC046939]|uniref:acyl carrier protein n=1 Tax=Streptomyces sp. NPDC046939 TaxID=3155376 RepID=UPI0033F7BFBF
MVHTHTPRDETSPAIRLALQVLFGDSFADGAEPLFVKSLETQPEAWASALKAIWAITGGTPFGLGALSGQSPSAPTALATAAEPTALSAAPAAPAAASHDARPSTVEVFDPAASDGPESGTESGTQRETPWSYEEVRDELVALLEELTGYPADVLDEDADLEADLAIDSVKQVEALVKVRTKHELPLEDDFTIRDYRTIRKAATYLTERLNGERAGAASAVR